IFSQGAAQRIERGRPNIPEVGRPGEIGGRLDTRTPGDNDAVARVSTAAGISVDKYFTVTGALVANELVAPRNHHHIGKAIDVTPASRLLPPHHSFKDR